MSKITPPAASTRSRPGRAMILLNSHLIRRDNPLILLHVNPIHDFFLAWLDDSLCVVAASPHCVYTYSNPLSAWPRKARIQGASQRLADVRHSDRQKVNLPMLRLLSSEAQGRNYFWKTSKPCHVGIHGTTFTEYSQMCTRVPKFQLFLHHFVTAKLATSSIRVKPSNAEATFVRSTRTWIFLKNI